MVRQTAKTAASFTLIAILTTVPISVSFDVQSGDYLVGKTPIQSLHKAKKISQ